MKNHVIAVQYSCSDVCQTVVFLPGTAHLETVFFILRYTDMLFVDAACPLLEVSVYVTVRCPSVCPVDR